MFKPYSLSAPRIAAICLMITASIYFAAMPKHSHINIGADMVFDEPEISITPVITTRMVPAVQPKAIAAPADLPQVAPMPATMTPPKILYREFPIYPETARIAGSQGTVVVRALIGENGNIMETTIRVSSGSDMLDKCAASSVSNWKFTPAKKGADTVASWMEIPFRFEVK